jgi:D-alanine-D-alanine ligase
MPQPRELVVLYGGPSAEHDVSCISALRIAQCARQAGTSVTAIGLTRHKQWVNARSTLDTMADTDALRSPDLLLDEQPHLVLPDLQSGLPAEPVIFPILHGPFGEDGVIQGHLEALGVPYIGAGVLASAVCMDKDMAKSVLHHHGLPVAAWQLVGRTDDIERTAKEAAEALGLPIFVKPSNLGSSIGVSKVTEASALRAAIELAFEFDDFVILEESVVGRELELAVLGNEDVRVTQAGEIVASRDFYDYEDKYLLGVAKTIAPTDLTGSELTRAQELAVAAYRALRVEGLARVDLFLSETQSFVINEVNTMPGFTPISMYPMLWAVEGLSLASLIDQLITLALARHARRRRLRTTREP